MKRIILNILLLNIIALILFSCQKDEKMAIVSASPTAAVLTASTTTLVLTKATLTDTVETFSITAADFGFEAGITNTLEFAVKGTNFATVKSSTLAISSSSSLTKKYTTKELNEIMLSLNLPTGVPSDVEVRLVSKISEKVSSINSNVITLKVTPFALVAFIYVPGDYQGWNKDTADSLMSATGNGIYTGVIDFSVKPTGSLKHLILPAKSWSNKYTDGGTGLLIYNGTTDLIAPAANSYKITANLNTNTIAYEKHSYGIIGDATPTGWNTPDTKMKYNNGTEDWSVTIALTAGVGGKGKGFKFRLNDAWATNYGGANGVLNTTSDNNIPVPADGTYKVSFNITKGTYSLVKQ
jgi:starch-binding outer membrane protein SusE/F